MGRVKSNDVTVNMAFEATPGVLPGSPKWFTMEPNEITNFGANITTVPRDAIDGSRDRQKGKTVGLDSPLELDMDLTYFHMRKFAESFCYARAVGPENYETGDATGTGYTVSALSADQAAQILYGATDAKTLVYARGYVEAANNGLKPVSAAHSASDTEIVVSGLTAETLAATRYAEVSIAGVRAAAGDLEIDANGDLISTALDFTTLDLSRGQVIHIGGIDALNNFSSPANVGFVRLKSIAQNKLELERREQDFVTDDGTVDNAGGAGVEIDLLFGQFIRNVRGSDADYRETTCQFELTSPRLAANGDDRYEYAIGNYADALTITLPEEEKATLKIGFTGLDTITPTATRASGANEASLANAVESYGSTSDLARLRLIGADETGMGSDFKTLTIAIKNNTAGEKVLGNLGPKYINPGTLEIDLDAEMIFTDEEVITAIRENKTVGIDFTLRNDDGGTHFDIPAATMGGGNRTYPRNESVKINTTIMAHRDSVLGTSIGISMFPVLPSA